MSRFEFAEAYLPNPEILESQAKLAILWKEEDLEYVQKWGYYPYCDYELSDDEEDDK